MIEIGLSGAGGPELTFPFRIMVDGVEPGGAAEKEFAVRMEADYLDAVRTTLRAVRDRVGAAAGALPE